MWPEWITSRLKPSSKNIEAVGRFLGLMIGSAISPMWPLMSQSLSPYIDLHALNDVNAAVPVVSEFTVALFTQDGIAVSLVAPLCFAAFIGFGCVYLCGFVGGALTRMLLQHYQPSFYQPTS